MNIWIKINNKIDNPKEWINQGYISFASNNPSNSHAWLELPKSSINRRKIYKDNIYYFASQLKPDDCIYVFEVANKTSLLTYRFIISSFYLRKIHGYKIKNADKCLDISYPI